MRNNGSFCWVLNVAVICLTMFFLSGCSSTPTEFNTLASETKLKKSSKFPKYPDRTQLMSPGFAFKLDHLNDKKLRGIFIADFIGNLYLPYKVRVNVKHKTLKELRSEIMTRYSKFFNQSVGNVSLSLLRKHYWVEVRGMVKNPGRFRVHVEAGLDELIKMAGGIDGDISSGNYIASITQYEKKYSIDLNRFFTTDDYIGDKPNWTGGDVIFIKQQNLLVAKSFVSILGGVANPGKIKYIQGADLFSYLIAAGGMNDGVAYEECYIMRRTPDGTRQYQFDLTKPETIPEIMPNDIVMLHSEVRSTADRALEYASRIASIIATAALLIIAL